MGKKVTVLETTAPFGTPLVQPLYHRIKCPYPSCDGGFAIVTVEKTRRGVEFDINTPHKCEKCGKYFSLKAELKIFGVPIR